MEHLGLGLRSLLRCFFGLPDKVSVVSLVYDSVGWSVSYVGGVP